MMIFALILILSYLLGSIPSGLLIGKTFYGKDIREHGSGNLGGTNTFRTLGVKAGMIVTIMDILKGTLATLLPLMFASDVHMLLAGVFAVIGHMYPVFANFRGGKAVATSAGVLLGYNYILFLILLAVFFICLYATKYVSLSSMIAAVLAFTYSVFTGDIPLIIVVGILTIFVIYRHRANIVRIKNKTEPKIKWL
ncbi:MULTISPECIES: glycerol-3-phosphate 1-O-acyltransferase PlsY [Rossellomorea]|uniref:Glycerol-3-phosphate 1-O-acyltransferase PlsY n=2 Tax=Rossellomorea vietnamensis TaxID=218284 RepID=A0ACD4C8V8_9BACI|nr:MULTISPECIES: glycerol-3-phosphate 1-O-acyltransferase PlsY [Rossellomorea]MCC5802518.1 glycerol-3-phosphate 1-O-acyltransferase PlsY [Rossellomorea vietnamensis]MCR8847370.1 glycerol-3-phosphate 1-O-acyltransferase PlsY [Rossellomorea sp. SC111]UXH45013.1 glycerol-3-phosphate 1-O-acyltransferase PlsY [Rossellomorea vietnamensis]WQI96370.1 glycerol-3-phosphate 1-O-acyltransferase PlsY [Rossellomorea vietnamensis]